MTHEMFLLVVTSGAGLNLILQLGLGARAVASELTRPVRHYLVQWALLWAVSVLSWLFFALAASPLGLGFAEYILLLPFDAALLLAADALLPRLVYGAAKKTGIFSPLSAYSGIAAASSLFILRLSSSFSDTLILAAGFSAGAFLAVALIRAIYKRIESERGSVFFCGIPLILISLGLLSLIFAALARVLFRG